MTKNKAIAALMAALMALSVFTGCQPKPQPAPPVEDTVMSSIEKTAAGQYLTTLLSDKLITDIDRDLRDGTTAGFDVTGAVWDETANTITVSVSMKSYDLDGIDGSLAATGEADIVFEGEVNDIYFEADAYTVNAEDAVFEGGKTAQSLSLSNIKGAFVGETGNETLSFIARDHKVESIIQGDQGVVHFGEPASGTVKADGRFAVTVKDVIDAYNETLTPEEPETLPAETTADVNAIFGGAYDAFTVWETSTKDFTAGGYTGKAELTVSADKSWSMHVMADKDAKAGEPTATVYDIEFTVTSEDVEKGNAIAVKVEGKEYTAPVADVIEGVIEEEVPFEWDITARLAKHSRGAAEDHDNWEHIQSLEYKNGTISIVADVDAMVTYASTNPNQGDGKWFAVLVGTGEDDITAVSYKGTALTDSDIAERDDMLGADGSKAESDEFVIWYKAEVLAESGAEFMLSHDGVEAETVKVELADYDPDMTAEEKSALQGYIFGFGHDKTIQDLNAILRGFDIAGIEKPYGLVSGSDKIMLTLELDGYDYDGSHGDKTITGIVNYEFIGGVDDNDIFQASEYAYWTGKDGITFKGGDSEITAVIAHDDPVTGKFSSKSVGGIELALSFIMDGDEPAGIVSEDLQVVKLQAPTDGSISTLTSVPASITDILGDVSGYEDAVAGADADDLYGMVEYVSLAQLRNREKLWWAGTNQTLDGWTSADAVYDAADGTMTFDITLTDYNYSTTGKTVSGNLQLVFHGVEDTVDGKPVLIADTWQIVADEDLEFEGGKGALYVGSVDLTGPIVKGKTINGTPATITFPLNGTMWDRSEFGGDFTAYIAKYLPDQYIGFSDLVGSCEYGGDKISGEMFNYLIETYGGLLG